MAADHNPVPGGRKQRNLPRARPGNPQSMGYLNRRKTLQLQPSQLPHRLSQMGPQRGRIIQEVREGRTKKKVHCENQDLGLET